MATTDSILQGLHRFLPIDATTEVNILADLRQQNGVHDIIPESQDSEIQTSVPENEVDAGNRSKEASHQDKADPGPSLVVGSLLKQADFSKDLSGTLLVWKDLGVELNIRLRAVPTVYDVTPEFSEPEVLSDSAPATTLVSENPKPNVSALVIDLGDVCCKWTAPEAVSISPAMLHRLLKTTTWYQYDSGEITQDECYHQLATQYRVAVADVAEAFKQAARSLSPDEEIFGIIRDLRNTYRDSLKIYLMSNIPSPEWEAVRSDTRYDWTLFDGFFPSGEVGMCKPELRFFRHVLQEIKLKPKDVVFIDDNGENILAARSLGIRCHRYRGVDGLKQFARLVFQDSIERGREWIHKHAKNMWSETTHGREVRDNFAQLFLYEACGDLNSVSMTFYERTWNYYIEKPIDTVEKHPDDIDTTSMAMVLLPQEPLKVNSILDEMLTHTNKDGIIMTYFDTKRPRIDPIVCINAVRFFYKYGRGECTAALEPTKSWISDVLFYRAYLDGTYYYPTGDVFLYLFSRLLAANLGSDIHRSTSSLLRERLTERIGTPGDALELAMRVIACIDMEARGYEVDLRRLEAMQEENGSWPVGWLCQTGKISLKIGNKGVTTAFAVKAVEMGKKWQR